MRLAIIKPKLLLKGMKARNKPFLRLKRVAKFFGDDKTVKALKPLSLSVNKGEHLFVIGETGSGKSTLLKCLAGKCDLEEGTILLNGEEVLGPQQNLIPGHDDIQLVEQEFGLKKFNSVYQNLEMTLNPHLLKKEKSARIKEMLNLFGLQQLKNKLPTELSGGQQQRLALAVALIELPKLLLLDEPFAHFDPQLKSKIFEYLSIKIQTEQITVVTVTHDYRETLKHADKVLILEKGKKVQFASVHDCYYKPKNLYCAGLLSEFNAYKFQGKQFLLRPEELQTDSKGKIGVQVTDVAFSGHFTELLVSNTENEHLLMYVPNGMKYQIGDSLKVSVENLSRVINEKGIIEYLD